MTREKKAANRPLTPRRPQWMQLLVLIVPVLLYANTIRYEYAHDDHVVILQNDFAQQGFAGIGDIFTTDAFDGTRFLDKGILPPGRYRPISMATFAIEWEFFGENPQVSHFINVLLFALTVLLLFRFLEALLRNLRGVGENVVPLLATLLFAAHPIHTEVVANIKGRDEILALLFGLLAMLLVLRFARSGQTNWLFLAAPVCLLALLSKESAYPLVAMVPLAAIVFLRGETRSRMFVASAVFAAVAALGIVIRSSVVGVSLADATDLMNHPFVDASSDQRLATIFFVLGKYLQLLFFPHPLTNDYYPYHIELQTFSDPLVIGAVAVNLTLGLAGIWLTFGKRHLLGFSILFYLIGIFIVSNLVIPVGAFMAERFLFIPSVGFCIAIAWLTGRLSRGELATARPGAFLSDLLKKNALGALLLAVLLGGYGFRTITRNADWKDSYTLYLADAAVSANSAKANNAAGGTLYMYAIDESDAATKRAYLTRSKKHLLKAIEVHPGYQAAWMTLGNVLYFLDNDMDGAISCYRKADPSAYQNLKIIANDSLNKGQYEDAITAFNELNRLFPGEPDYLIGLGRAHGQGRNDLDSAIDYLTRAVESDPAHAEALKNLGTAHAFRAEQLINANQLQAASSEVLAALSHYLRAEQLDPNDRALLNTIANAFSRFGNEAEAERYRSLAAGR